MTSLHNLPSIGHSFCCLGILYWFTPQMYDRTFCFLFCLISKHPVYQGCSVDGKSPLAHILFLENSWNLSRSSLGSYLHWLENWLSSESSKLVMEPPNFPGIHACFSKHLPCISITLITRLKASLRLPRDWVRLMQVGVSWRMKQQGVRLVSRKKTSPLWGEEIQQCISKCFSASFFPHVLPACSPRKLLGLFLKSLVS